MVVIDLIWILQPGRFILARCLQFDLDVHGSFSWSIYDVSIVVLFSAMVSVRLLVAGVDCNPFHCRYWNPVKGMRAFIRRSCSLSPVAMLSLMLEEVTSDTIVDARPAGYQKKTEVLCPIDGGQGVTEEGMPSLAAS